MTPATQATAERASRSLPAISPKKLRAIRRHGLIYLARILVPVAVIAAWHVSVSQGWVGSFVASNPQDVWDKFREWLADGTIVEAAAHTAFEAVVGYVIGVLIGSALAIAFASWGALARVHLPIMTILNAVPRLSFAPLFVAWLGFGASSKIALVVLVVVFVNFFSIYSGLKEIPHESVAWVRCLGASPRGVWRHLRIPAVGVWLMSSLRVSVGLAFGAAIVGEFLGSDSGLGYLISSGSNLFQSESIYAGLLATVIVVGLLDFVLRLVENRITRWQLTN